MEGFMTIDWNKAVRVEDDAKIVADVICQEQRADFLPHFFGMHFMRGEAAVYATLQSMCQEYDGGYWEFYMLSNGGFYMAPAARKTFHLSCEGNGFEGEVSANAAGIIATLMALNALVWKTEDQALAESFYRLRDYALQHRESRSILRAID
jgi:hypothetical protein